MATKKKTENAEPEPVTLHAPSEVIGVSCGYRSYQGPTADVHPEDVQTLKDLGWTEAKKPPAAKKADK